jgi:putative transposase
MSAVARYPAEIISHCVRLYHRFPLSFREVEEMMERGMVVTYETIRQWCRTFGADLPERSAPSPATPGDKWHLDEVFIKVHGKRHVPIRFNDCLSDGPPYS